jgi:hypothetical protein
LFIERIEIPRASHSGGLRERERSKSQLRRKRRIGNRLGEVAKCKKLSSLERCQDIVGLDRDGREIFMESLDLLWAGDQCD